MCGVFKCFILLRVVVVVERQHVFPAEVWLQALKGAVSRVHGAVATVAA